MQIHELNSRDGNISNSDFLVLDTGTETVKITYETLAAAIVSVLGGNVVSVEHGGTGASTVAGARNALGLGNTSGALPIANGGTGATSATDAKAALSLGTAAQNFSVDSPAGLTATQLYRISNTVQNSSSALDGKRIGLYVNANGLMLYNNTDSANVWRLVLPVPVSQGGTGAESAVEALENLGVDKKTVSGTTTSAGGLSASLTWSRYIILSAYAPGYICIPYRAASANSLYIKVLDTSLQPVASESVTVTITYLDMGEGAFS